MCIVGQRGGGEGEGRGGRATADTAAQPGNHLKKPSKARSPGPPPGGDGTAFASAFSGMDFELLEAQEVVVLVLGPSVEMQL